MIYYTMITTKESVFLSETQNWEHIFGLFCILSEAELCNT